MNVRVGRVGITILSILLVLSIFLILYAVLTGTPMRYLDERDYVEIANNLYHGRGFLLHGRPTAFRPPAWPVTLAAFLPLGIQLSVVSTIFMIGAALSAAILGMKLSHSEWGSLAGIAVLCYPLNIYTSVLLYPQAFATFLLIALWVIFSIVAEGTTKGAKRRALWHVALGLIAALLALSVPILAFTSVTVIAWTIFATRKDRPRVAIYSLLGFTIPIGLWTARNIAVLGAAVPLSTSGGYNLFIGNNPTTTGSSGVAANIHDAPQIATMSEIGRDEFYRNLALRWIVEHPFDSLALYLAKLVNYFSPYNQPITPVEGGSIQRIIAYFSFGLLLSCILIRIVFLKWLPFAATEILFLGIFLANAFVMAIFFTRTRFRQPLDNILVVEAVVTLVIGVSLIQRRRKQADREVLKR